MCVLASHAMQVEQRRRPGPNRRGPGRVSARPMPAERYHHCASHAGPPCCLRWVAIALPRAGGLAPPRRLKVLGRVATGPSRRVESRLKRTLLRGR
eukprot:CAMPEP_0176275772 /NCGR_PEP_ID=MMETSP0121_2-20121125/47412_1 /TAXON_ID=160619 /ORGANISM="Kryptoperidinium foliaceum, Strain CCMP 1326" /LENGTH=95 /DNA_ID=CAMNT_0017616007 /DNA_START=65 /DNA_END=349 /DNA_ORIENTATION=-